ncbi:MAG: hypothetical protein KF897_03195 [Opitutaceae bacterium]|nr:hypothetical protein [Opitutaceae bacterium]
MDARINVSPELTTLRESKFYLELRPYIVSMGAKYPFAQSRRIEEADDDCIALHDRFYFMVDFIFGDVFTNIRTRRWIKFQLLDLIASDNIDEVGVHFLLRSYLNELIILMERLQRLISLLANGIEDKVFTKALDRDVLRFFNPLLSDKRNHNHHELYLGYPREGEVKQAVRKAQETGEWTDARQLFEEVIGAQIKWCDYTEESLAPFLRTFFDKIETRLKTNAGYFTPQLPPSFSLKSKLRRTLRSLYDHEQVFKEGRSPGPQ